MFQSLSDRLSNSLRSITGKATLTEDNIQETLREVRMALLEADVALPVVKQFVESVKQRRCWPGGDEKPEPGPGFSENSPVRARVRDGLRQRRAQSRTPAAGGDSDGGAAGAGKTTSVAKLAKLLKEREKKR